MNTDTRDVTAGHVASTPILVGTANILSTRVDNMTTDKLVDFNGNDTDDAVYFNKPAVTKETGGTNASAEADGSDVRVPETTTAADTPKVNVNNKPKNQSTKQQKQINTQKDNSHSYSNNSNGNSVASTADPGVIKLYLDSISNVAALYLEQREEEAAKKLLQKLLRLKMVLYGKTCGVFYGTSCT